MAMGDAGDEFSDKMTQELLKLTRELFEYIGRKIDGSSRGSWRDKWESGRSERESGLAAAVAADEALSGEEELASDENLWAANKSELDEIIEFCEANNYEYAAAKPRKSDGMVRVSVPLNRDARPVEEGGVHNPLERESEQWRQFAGMYSYDRAKARAAALAAAKDLGRAAMEQIEQVEFVPGNPENGLIKFKTQQWDPDGNLLLDAFDRAGIATYAVPGSERLDWEAAPAALDAKEREFAKREMEKLAGDPDAADKAAAKAREAVDEFEAEARKAFEASPYVVVEFDCRNTPQVEALVSSLLSRKIRGLDAKRFPGYARAIDAARQSAAKAWARETEGAPAMEQFALPTMRDAEIAAAVLAESKISATAAETAAGASLLVDSAELLAGQHAVSMFAHDAEKLAEEVKKAVSNRNRKAAEGEPAAAPDKVEKIEARGPAAVSQFEAKTRDTPVKDEAVAREGARSVNLSRARTAGIDAPIATKITGR